MKKMILAATVLAMAGASLQTAKAGDREWATAGKVLTGVIAGAVIASALDCPPAHASVVYTYIAPAYCPPPAVAYAPVTAACAPPGGLFAARGCVSGAGVCAATCGVSPTRTLSRIRTRTRPP